jgi:chaperonin GroEL (HSP60 family)
MLTLDVCSAQELENAVILIHEKKITSLQSILPVLELVVRVRFHFGTVCI